MDSEARLNEVRGAAGFQIEKIRIVVALANDVLDARADLETGFANLDRVADSESLRVSTEVVAWCTEDSRPDFYRESPHALVEAIRREYQPDAIIGIFWSRFGANSLGSTLNEQEATRLAALWGGKDHPRVLLYFNEKDPAAKDETWQFVREFKRLFGSEWKHLWWDYKRRSVGRKTPRRDELSELVSDHLLPLARKRSSELQARAAATGRQERRVEAIPVLKFALPPGWEQITTQKLEGFRRRLRDSTTLKREDAEAYFNGTPPNWDIALSESVPRRQKVWDLKKEIVEAAYDERLRITLLVGPGGEGKSTILQQLAVELAETCPGVYVIVRNKRGGALGEPFVRQLLNEKGSFVIVSDDAQEVSDGIYDVAMLVRQDSRHNVQFLLASKTIDWLWQRGAPPFVRWERDFGGRDFEKVVIRGLDSDDAEEFAKKWKEAGTLGELAKVPEADRAQYLCDLAQEEQGKRPNEGSLLGALLRARKGEGVSFQAYVEDLLGRLAQRPISRGKKLQDAFAYIAALHADAYLADPEDKLQCPPLFKPVLQRALSCETPDELEDKVITPLADEAATSTSEKLVMARHYAIAEVAKEILSAQNPLKFARDIYADLLRAALTAYHQHKQLKDDEITPWHRMPQFYFRHHQTDLALHLAEVAAHEQPGDPYPLSMWADLCRELKEYARAVNVFRDHYELVELKRRDKGLYYEWGVSEGLYGNDGFAVWLKAIALSDTPPERHSGDAPPIMRLSGISTSLLEMHKKTSDTGNDKFRDSNHAAVFLRAAAAAAQLGLDERARKDSSARFNSAEIKRSERHLNDTRRFALNKGIRDVGKEEAFDLVLDGIQLAWELRDKDDGQEVRDKDGRRVLAPLPDTLSPVNARHFGKLRATLGVKDEPKQTDAASSIDHRRPV